MSDAQRVKVDGLWLIWFVLALIFVALGKIIDAIRETCK